MSSPLAPGLVRLGFRRALPLTWWLALVLLLWIAATRDYAPEGTTSSELSPEQIAVWTRQGLWSVFIFVVLPISVWRFATLGQHWRRLDVDWLGALPWEGWKLSASMMGGALTALLCVSLCAFLATQFFIQGDPEKPLRFVRAFEHPALMSLDGDEALELTLTGEARDPRDVASLFLTPSVAPGSGPAVDVRFVLRSADGRESSAERRIFARTPITLPLLGTSPWTLSVERGVGAALYLTASSMALIAPAQNPWEIDLVLFWHGFLGLAAWSALAFGLGAWMRPSLAVGTSLTLCVVPWSFGVFVKVLPAGAFLRGLSRLAEGIGPASTSTASYISALALVVASVWLLRRALHEGRSGA